MSYFDTYAFIWGFVAGLPVAALFFWGLGWGMQRALRSRQPGLMLLLSFFIRAALLLVLAFGLTRYLHPLSALAGYLLAFILVRTLMVKRVRRAGVASSGPSGGGTA